MFETILYNLEMIGCAMLLLAGAWLANTVVGVYYNTALNAESFDKKKLLHGAIKLLAVCLGSAIGCIVVTLLPMYLTAFGVEIPGEAADMFSVLAVAAIYAVAIVKYLKEWLAKLTEILK